MSEKQSKWPNQKIGSLTTAIPLTRRNKPPPPQTSPPSAPRPTTTCRAAAQSAPRRPLRTTDRRSAHAARNSDPTRAIDEERSACTRLQLVSSRAQRIHLRAGGTSQPSNRRLPPTTSALIPKQAMRKSAASEYNIPRAPALFLYNCPFPKETTSPCGNNGIKCARACSACSSSCRSS
jgi:hypothetical protein